jgi:hypothetical protein
MPEHADGCAIAGPRPGKSARLTAVEEIPVLPGIRQRDLLREAMEQSTIREAVAVFDDAEKLEAAVSELQSNGIDRSELSFLAHESPTGRVASDLPQAADDPATAREPVVSDTDLRQGRVLGTGLAATIAAFAAAGFTVATGGVGAAVAAAVVAAGGVGAASTLFGRRLADDQTSFLDAQLARGGVLLWVRTRNAAIEQTVLDVLRRRSAHVYLHDLPAETALH